jgi:hypothetical protein
LFDERRRPRFHAVIGGAVQQLASHAGAAVVVAFIMMTVEAMISQIQSEGSLLLIEIGSSKLPVEVHPALSIPLELHFPLGSD